MSESSEGRSSKPQRPSLRTLHFNDSTETNKTLQISFGGCGFLGVYHVGVGKCVVDHAPHLFSEFDTFYGASAGAITAVCAACRTDPMIPYKWVKKTFEASRKYWFGMYSLSFDLYARLRVFLEGYLPENAHVLCRNKVKISLTVFGDNGMPTNWLVSDFRTRKELINIIVASSFIPVYAGFKNLPLIRGKRCMDGGITSNIPCVSDPDVITVTPFSGFCDICPRGESNTQHMINICDQPMLLSPKNFMRLAKSLCPTSWDELEELYHQGYQDCLSFLRKEGLVPDPVIQKRRSSIVSCTNEVLCSGTGSCDSTGNHSRMTSMTLSASGEFFSCSGDSERGSVSSSPLEDFEKGLDLRGTEKATLLIRRFGHKESQLDESDLFLLEDLMEKSEGRVRMVVSKVIKYPAKLVLQLSWHGVSWMLRSCYHRQIMPFHWSALRKTQDKKEVKDMDIIIEEEPHENGLFGSIISSYPSSMFMF